VRQNLVLGFVNDLAEWCGHEGLPLSDRLERVRDALMSVLLDLRRVHLVTTGEPTVSGRRVMSLALLAPRHGLVLGLSRKQVRRGRQCGVLVVVHVKRSTGSGPEMIRAAVPVSRRKKSCGASPGYTQVNVTEAGLWRRLEGDRLMFAEQLALRRVVQAVVELQHVAWDLCRTCGRPGPDGHYTTPPRWLVRVGRTQDCIDCQKRESSWTRSRAAHGPKGWTPPPLSYDHAAAHANRRVPKGQSHRGEAVHAAASALRYRAVTESIPETVIRRLLAGPSRGRSTRRQ
jgi:hypothetical protein